MCVAQPVVVHFKLEHSVHIRQLELDAVLATWGRATGEAGLSCRVSVGLPRASQRQGLPSCSFSCKNYLPFFFKKVLTKGSMRTNSS